MSGEVIFTPTQADYVAANRLWYRSGPQRRWLQWLAIAVWVLALSDIIAKLAFGAPLLAAVADASTVLVVAIVFSGLGLLTQAQIPRQVRKMFKQRPSLGDSIECRWTDSDLAFSGRTGNSNQRWSEIYRWVADTDVFAFLLSERLMLIVPARALTEEQRADLDATARRFGPTQR